MKLTGLTSRRLKMLSVMLATASTLFGKEPISSKASQAWLTDFEAAKSLAAKESKLILVCSCLSDNTWWMWRLYNGLPTDTVYPRLIQTTSPGDATFIRKARRKFVLLRVNLANGLSDENCSEIRLNHPKIRNDDSNWWGYGDIRIVDAAGSFVKKVEKLEDVLSDDLFGSASGHGNRQAKKTKKKPKSDDIQPKITRIPSTKFTTPSGWMDNFRYAQEIALKAGKDLLVVFQPFSINCGMDKKPADEYRDFIYDSLMHHDGKTRFSDLASYRTAILTSPIIINALHKDFVLVYLETPGSSSPASDTNWEQKENELILRALLKKTGKAPPRCVGNNPITVLMTNDEKQISVIMDSWKEVSALKSMRKLKRRYAEQQLAEIFLDFIKEKWPPRKAANIVN